MVTPKTPVKSQDDFQKFKLEISKTQLGEVRKAVSNINWKKQLQVDVEEIDKSRSIEEKVQAPEPYCSRVKGAVVGRCNHLSEHCNSKNYRDCQCNGDEGSIEKCSKYFARSYIFWSSLVHLYIKKYHLNWE